jgi:5'-deoxynucleotidase YfbR-like HD superfamily hydrolase
MRLMLDKMNQTTVDSDMLAEREALIVKLADALEEMTTAAQQWERFNGTPNTTTAEIEAARQLIVEARSAL